MKIKNIINIALISIFFSAKVYSCDCANSSTLVKSFIEFEFVADITIEKTYTNIVDNKVYAQFKINKLYKGEYNNIIYFGESNYRTSCDISLEKGMNLIVYLNKHENKLSAGSCNRIIYEEELKKESEILKKITHYKTYKNNNFIESKIEEIQIDFSNKKLRPVNRYSIFEIEFDKKNQLKKINVISGYNSYINELLINKVKLLKWKKNKNSRHLIEFAYFNINNSYPRFDNKFFLCK